jgi:endoglucanase
MGSGRVNPVRDPSVGSIHVSPARRVVLAWSVFGVLLLSACAGGAEGGPADSAAAPERAAPARADYSVGADPGYTANLVAAQGYVPANKQQSLKNLIETPVAVWLFADDSAQTVREVLDRSAAGGSVPVLVAYNIPHRDDGGHSQGGSASAASYIEWIQGISDVIGQRDAVLVLEPDALAHLPDLPDADAAERVSMLAAALKVLAANTNTAVYLDAGNSTWRTPQVTAEFLRRISAHDVDVPGIALNVANYRPRAETEQYGLDVQHAYGEHLFVMIDNSRNGADGTGTEWCNPPTQSLGTISDRTFDPDAKVEEVYVKVPGESDGQCGISDKPAGEFDGDLLVAQLP